MQKPRHSDILILFEKEDRNFLDGLEERHITVQAAQIQENNVVFDESVDSALAMNVCHMETCRVKRKIVVFLENHQYPCFIDKKNKQRALTSCTSQLILVHFS